MPKTQLSFCADQVRAGDHDRFLCTLFAPSEEREGLYALYALSIELGRIPDAVSEPMLAMIRFRWWQDAVATAFAGSPPNHPIFNALMPSIEGGRVSKELLDQFVAARADTADADVPAPKTLNGLVDRLDRAFGSLGQLGLGILGVDTPEIIPAARNIAIARGMMDAVMDLGMTGAVRQREAFMPVEVVSESGLGSADWPERIYDDAFRRAIKQISQRAWTLVEQAKRRACPFPPAVSPVLLPAVGVKARLRALSAVGYDPRRLPPQSKSSPSAIFRLLLYRLRRRF